MQRQQEIIQFDFRHDDKGRRLMKLNRQQIHQRAMMLLEAHPNGIRWVELLRGVEADAPDTPHNSVHGAVHNL